MSRGLIDRDSFHRLQPAAQANLLRQTLLLYLTALELANRNPDDRDSAAFTAALDHLAAGAPLRAYDEVERLLLPPSPHSQPQAVTLRTGILRVEAGAAGQQPPPAKLDRNGMRRRLLQLSAVQLSSLDAAEARRSVLARTSRRHAQSVGAGDSAD